MAGNHPIRHSSAASGIKPNRPLSPIRGSASQTHPQILDQSQPVARCRACRFLLLFLPVLLSSFTFSTCSIIAACLAVPCAGFHSLLAGLRFRRAGPSAGTRLALPDGVSTLQTDFLPACGGLGLVFLPSTLVRILSPPPLPLPHHSLFYFGLLVTAPDFVEPFYLQFYHTSTSCREKSW